MALKITAPDVRARKAAGSKIVAVTAYDATLGRLLEEGGADVLLVGDSLGMVIQGLTTTLPVTIDEICYHGRAVSRAIHRAHLVGDLPFMSYQVSPEQAVTSAGRLLKEGGFEAVKLEGGLAVAEHVRRIVAAGIPVMGHVGLTPQSVHAMGGFRVQGRTESSAERILNDAASLEQAGVYSIVLEGLPSELARRITERVSVPTIGIGAGPHCDGQILVCYDLLGMFRDLRPKFVKRYAELGESILSAVGRYAEDVRGGVFPGPEHTFRGIAPPLTTSEPYGVSTAVSGEAMGYGSAGDEER